MTQVNLYPPVGFPSEDEAGNPVPVTGITVTLNTFYRNAVRDGYLLTEDPLGANDPSEIAVRNPSGIVYAIDYGLRNDGVELTDCVLTAASRVLTSASAAFSQSDVGKTILINTPSQPAAGTVAGTAGSVFLNGTGTSWVADYDGSNWGQPGSGAVMRVNGVSYGLAAVHSNTLIELTQLIGSSFSGQIGYKELQLKTTIESVQTSHSITLAAAPLLSGTSVVAFYGTDNSDALEAAIDAALALGAGVVQLPAGLIGVGRNLMYENVSRLTIAGISAQSTCLKELRGCYEEVIYTDPNAAVLCWRFCDRIEMRDFSLDASVPVLCYGHSSGGGFNANGGRIGFQLYNCSNSGYRRMGTRGYGSRDELFVGSGDCPGWYCIDCTANANNVGINLNTSDGGQDIIVSGNTIITPFTPLLLGGGSAVVDKNTFANVDGYYVGADVVVLDSSARVTFSNNIVREVRIETAGASCLHVFGSGVPTDAVINITGNVFTDVRGSFNLSCGLVKFTNFAGIARVSENVFIDCTSPTAGGHCVYVTGALTRGIAIASNTFDMLAGSNMSIGVFGDGTNPAGRVTQANNIFGASITTTATGI